MDLVLRSELSVVSLETIGDLVGEDVRKRVGGELFGLLCALTAGEANTVVRGVVGRVGGQCDFVVLKLMAIRFNPKTPARLLQFVLEVYVQGR